MKFFKIFLLLLGLLLFLASVPLSWKMMMEKVYDDEMEKSYKITELNVMWKGIPTSYTFERTKINVSHQVNNKSQSYRDPWGYLINEADVSISINGETKEVLRDYPVKIEEEGLNRYTHYVSYWIVEDKKTNEKSFVIILQKNGANMKELPNGHVEGFVPKEETQYLSLAIQENGDVTKEEFSYEHKNKLQTKLIPPLNNGGSGYYTDAWFAYPVFFFPFIYPFLTTLIGMILILINIPKKKS